VYGTLLAETRKRMHESEEAAHALHVLHIVCVYVYVSVNTRQLFNVTAPQVAMHTETRHACASF
jgi:hypothetical protein